MSAYRSILPPRAEPVDRADFDSVLAGSIENIDGARSAEKISDLTLTKWNRNIPLSPASVQDLFTRNFNDDISLKLGTLSDSVSLVLVSGSNDLFEGELQHIFGKKPYERRTETHFRVAPHYRGKGTGKSWGRARIELCVAFGDNAFRFCAGLDNGGYAWAKMGAHLDMSAQHASKRDHVSRQMLSILEGVRPFIGEKDYGHAARHCKLEWPYDLTELAKMDCPIPADVANDLQGQQSGVLRRMVGSFAEKPLKVERPMASAGDVRKSMLNAFAAATAQKRELTLGRCLLNGRYWNAIVDFNDAPQMRAVEQFLGGWRTIEPSC